MDTRPTSSTRGKSAKPLANRIYLHLSVEISPGISLEGMMLKLKLQYFGHFMRRVDSLEKTLMLGPQDEAGLTTTFQTWPRGWFHIPKDPDFPVPS